MLKKSNFEIDNFVEKKNIISGQTHTKEIPFQIWDGGQANFNLWTDFPSAPQNALEVAHVLIFFFEAVK